MVNVRYTSFVNQPVAVFLGKGVKQMLKLFCVVQNRIAELRDREEGQTFVEYGVLIAIVAIGAIALLLVFRGKLGDAFGTLGDKLKGAIGQ